MPRPAWAAIVLAVIAAAAAAGGCSRLSVLDGRIAAIDDPEARQIIRDALWVSGSKYAWVKHDTVRAEVTWTEHTPLGDTSTDEVWLVGLWDGRIRIEAAPPSPSRERELAGSSALGTALAARLARELLLMPLALAEPGLKIKYAGTREGPAEARVWQRLLVAYAGPGATVGAGADSMVVEVLRATRQVDSVIIQWQTYPLVGRPMRVDMKLWEAAGDISVSRLWRFYPADADGRTAGDERYTLRVHKVEFDVATGAFAFEKP